MAATRPRPAEATPIAVCLIVAGDGRLLLQHRDDDPEIFAPGMWGLFGGGIEPGETPAEALLRELQEELAWRPAHVEEYVTRDLRDGDRRWRSNVFAAHLDRPVEQLVLREGQGLALFLPDALPQALIPGIAEVIAAFVRSQAYRRVRRAWDAITTTGLLVDAAGGFLLQLRDDRPDIANPGLWGSFGGRVEPHETPAEGFLRELHEELSWRPRRHTLYVAGPYRTLADGDARSQLIYVYAAPVDAPLSSMRLGEGRDMAVFAPDSMPTTTVPALRALVERFAADPLYRQMREAASRRR